MASTLNVAEVERWASALGGINVERSVTINRSENELYEFWRGVERLPRVMRYLVSVRRLDEYRSHWVAKAPMGRTVEWDAEIINEIPNTLFADHGGRRGADHVRPATVETTLPRQAGRMHQSRAEAAEGGDPLQ